jgi:hypothetical protein
MVDTVDSFDLNSADNTVDRRGQEDSEDLESKVVSRQVLATRMTGQQWPVSLEG